MAENPSTGNFANYGIILAALISGGALIVPHFPSLLDTRPRSEESSVYLTASAQDIDARLWQDPFGVVARAAKEDQNKGAGAVQTSCRRCAPPIDQLTREYLSPHENPLIIGVSLPGGPYAENVEERRRSRYAVVSGLNVMGYAPKDAQHIGYYQLADSEPTQSPATIPFELFETKSPNALNKKIVLLWLNDDMATRPRPLLHFCNLLNLVDREKQGIQVIGPQRSDTLRDLVKDAKDWSETSDCGNASASLQKTNFYASAATVEDRALLSSLEIVNFTSIHDFLESRHIHLLRTVATDDVVARALVRELRLRGVEPGLEQRNSFRPQSENTSKSPSGEQHVALISEWDTFYGQTFPCTLQKSFAYNDGNDPCEKAPPWVHKFSYLRGLDGALPSSGKDDPKRNASGDEQRDADKDQKDKTNAEASDLPFGDGQFDYLRRLAGEIKSLDDELKRTDQGGIKAIGVLGTDVFDKLLVLRGLKFQFPEAVFFTTDFDEAFTIESKRSWTRNLIIASSFGPELARPFQGAIPPFRESYQTAVFLATELAVMDALKRKPRHDPPDSDVDLVGPTNISSKEGSCATATAPAATTTTANDRPLRWPADDEQNCISLWLAHPPTFEIGRSGTPLPLPRHATPSPVETSDCQTNLKNCKDIQPPDHNLFPSINLPIRLVLAVFCVLGFGYALVKGGIYREKLKGLQKASHFRENSNNLRFTDFSCWVFTLSLFLFAQLGFFLLVLILGWPWVAAWLTGNGDGELLILFEGASLWPSIALRLVTLILSVALIFLGWEQLETNLNALARSMDLGESPQMRIKRYNSESQNLKWYKKLGKCFIVNPREGQHRSGLYKINNALEHYLVQGRPFARFCRVIAMVCVMMIVSSTLFAIFGSPLNAGRSNIVRMIYGFFTICDVLLMFFLIFFVVDATLFCFLFVRQLAKGPTLWPADTRRLFMSKLGLDLSSPPIGDDHNVLDDWIDLYFIKKRTACINTLIYYPFAVIALMIVSRSAVLGDFPLSVPILITQGVSLLIVIGCAIALNRVAEEARALAKRRLMDEIIKAKGTPESGRSGQWESLLDHINGLQEGAFRPFLQQPMVGAVLLPLSSFGWTSVLDKVILGQ